MLCLLNISSLMAQFGGKSVSCMPLKSGNSAMYYGNDVLINDQVTQDQRHANIAVAYNGWLYAAYTYSTTTSYGVVVMKSTDNGQTWTLFISADFGSTIQMTTVDIVAAGNTPADFKIFLAGIRYNIGTNYVAWVDVYDPTTGVFQYEILDEPWTNQIMDIKIASDYLYPAHLASPYSLGILYSKRSIYDTIVFCSSGDGGNTISSRYAVSETGAYTNKVALSYGISSNYNNGRYFAAWEEFDNLSTSYGHIYTAHSNPYAYSPFTQKISLDSATNDANITNSCRNPSISTMYNSTIDNANLDVTEIVLFDRFYTSTDMDVLGMFNEYALAAAQNDNWNLFDIDNTSDYCMESDINYDPGYNNFLVTYFDSTTMKLPYIVHSLDMSQPNNWIVISPGYNDNSNLINPFPKVEINSLQNKVANLWVGERPGQIGEVTYDAEYVTGIPEHNNSAMAKLEGAYPNPCNTTTKIRFDLTREQKVNVKIFNTFGQQVSDLTQNYTAGSHDMLVNVSTLPSGCYYYRFIAGDFTASGTIAVNR